MKNILTLLRRLFPKREWVEVSRRYLRTDFDEEESRFFSPWYEVWEVTEKCLLTEKVRRRYVEIDVSTNTQRATA
jgi:hypothetical protein